MLKASNHRRESHTSGSPVGNSAANLNRLPVGTAPPALPAPYFPDRLHAYVWRNWGLVEVPLLAAVIGASAGDVAEIAASMGLPREPAVSPMRALGYITLLRRNWHLLDYEQLLTLIGQDAEQLAFALREEDGLFIKLGGLKPACAPLHYEPPDAVARTRAAQIKQCVERHFPRLCRDRVEPRFDFLNDFCHASSGGQAGGPGGFDDSQPLRLAYSYCGSYGDPLNPQTPTPYPDGLLRRLQQAGINGIWLHSVLRQLAPGGPSFPEFGAGHEARLSSLDALCRRAGQFGIGLYLYVNEPRAMPLDFFTHRPEMAGVREGDYAALCTTDERVRAWISNALRHVFTAAPNLAGVFTITASENLTNCACRYRHRECLRCRDRTSAEIFAEINATIAAGVHAGNPRARVIAWDWGWHDAGKPWDLSQLGTAPTDWGASPHGDATDTIRRLPDQIGLMSVSEWNQPIERGGVRSAVGEYSLSVLGPGPRARRHWEAAARRNLKIVAKIQVNNSWELASVPWLPVVDLVAEHCLRLARAGIRDLMASWTLGGYPSLNLRVANLIVSHPQVDVDDVLDQVAEERYGAEAAPHVRLAWTAFSDALRAYPFDINTLYTGPQHMGPANPLYVRPTGYRATMVGIPYDDLESWRGRYSAIALAEQFARVADGWNNGLQHFEEALPNSSTYHAALVEEDLRIARAAHCHFASTANQIRFLVRRGDVFDVASRECVDDNPGSNDMISLLDSEIDLARALYSAAATDSRLGFEASNHYLYVPLDLVEKVLCCEMIRESFRRGKSLDSDQNRRA